MKLKSVTPIRHSTNNASTSFSYLYTHQVWSISGEFRIPQKIQLINKISKINRTYLMLKIPTYLNFDKTEVLT